MSRLSCDTQQCILKDPAREQEVNEQHSKKRKSTNTTYSVTTNEVNPEQNRLVAAIINGIQNSSQHKQPQSTQTIRYPTNSSRIIAAENVTNNNNYKGNNKTSVITYDHLGDPLLLRHSNINIS